jgi:hypothetical protein
MDKLAKALRDQFPNLNFVAGSTFCWAPADQQVTYKPTADQRTGRWSLLHETAHALLEHTAYTNDFELLLLEVAAWERARELANRHDIVIDEDHIQDCIDTYRDWLYKRSICPSCTTKCLQQADSPMYRCFNCHTTWRVTPSRFCRSYRSTKPSGKADLQVFHVSA